MTTHEQVTLKDSTQAPNIEDDSAETSDIEDNTTLYTNEQKKRSNVRWLTCLIFVLFILSAIAIGIYLITQKWDNKESNAIIHNSNHHSSQHTRINGRERRKNEDECKLRRCCQRKEGIKQNELPRGLDCKNLDDEECGENDDYCDWDCSNSGLKRGMNRKYRGISLRKGNYTEPTGNISNKTIETLDDFRKGSKFVSMDDCGVMWEEELPEEIIIWAFNNRKKRRFTNGTQHDSNETEIEDGNNHRRLDVIGTDGRTQVTSTGYPYRAVFYFTFTNSYGGTSRCTATAITPYWAITAAHCVYGGGDWYSNGNLYKNVVNNCGDASSANQIPVSYFVTFSEWIASSPWEYDIAWVRTSNYMNTGYFGIGYDSSFSGTKSFNLISHPADKPDCTKWHQYCPYTYFWRTDTITTFDCDTYGGASGSGVYLYWSSISSRVIYAIHAKGACYDIWGNYYYDNVCNTAIRITESKFNAICTWLEYDHPGWCD